MKNKNLIRMFLASIPLVLFASCGETEYKDYSVDDLEPYDLTPKWKSLELPELDSTYFMQDEEFYDGRMSIMGKKYPNVSDNKFAIDNGVTQTMVYERFFETDGPSDEPFDDVEIQFREANDFNRKDLKGLAPENYNDIISAVLFRNDSTILYEYFMPNDKGERKFNNFLLERQGYFLSLAPNAHWLDNHEDLLFYIALAETFKVTQKPVDHSLSMGDLFDREMEKVFGKRD